MSRSPAGVLLAIVILFGVGGVLPAMAKKKPSAPPLSAEHVHPSGVFSFRTPENWRVGPGVRPDVLEAVGGGIIFRFTHSAGEVGYDSLHALCMLDRLAPAMQTHPHVKYEHDFVDGVWAGRRTLDSSFVVRYDPPVRGHREWWQRNFTIVGEGQSLCVTLFAPKKLRKKSSVTRALLDGVLGSLRFR